ncbi:GNAT family N-acetyltransferase [Hydrococcus rivularis NIES-593]|uniref:GNAT family N-acetyltransferase n=1 Tax=Hydrococcus rivularis NIES-593 TaxID=1921803 RepID=A0A1U7HPL4_9CYAN|nr:GNAT family N-acetyltransferase [Hydrococcus rivularis]OKH25526.1 GNAT family N-acetyltransferase [Hydrococcus rivularis NIES-593]
MNSFLSDTAKILVRPAQYRDLEAIEALAAESSEVERLSDRANLDEQVQQLRRWYGPLKFLSLFPNPFQYHFCVYVAELVSADNRNAHKLLGWIQVAPFNKTRSTWQVGRVSIARSGDCPVVDPLAIGSQLLRYCFETIWEARTWVLELDVNEKGALALYRHNGFQPLAQMTYWSLAPDLLAELAQNDPDLPNLLPISNADAQLLFQLDCVSMPPLLRQVFDRHVQDFKTSFVNTLLTKFNQWCHRTETISGYVFEPQRKAAIGYFQLNLQKNGSRPHQARLTVHPAYTWLYPKLLAQMARLVKDLPSQELELVSADYQHEREEYLEKLGAQRIAHTLLMSRSVWHKLKETKPEGLQLSEMLQGLQAIPRTPIPSRMSWQKVPFQSPPITSHHPESSEIPSNSSSKNGKTSDGSSEGSDINPQF